jgi:hypothetical protein
MILLTWTALCLPLAQEPQPAAAAQPSPAIAAIRAACAKLTEAPNYTFHHLSLDEGMPLGRGFGAPGGGGPPGEGQAAAQPPAPVPVEFLAQVQKDQPVHFQQGGMEAWRKEGVLVWRNAGGAWQRSDMQSGRGGGGERPSEEEMRAMRARMGLFTAQTAQEFIGGFETKLAMVTETAEAGKTVYSGTLTPEGAASFGGARMGRGGRGGQGGQGGQGGAAAGGPPPFQHSGSFKLIVDAGGRIESLTLDTLTSGSFDGNPIERKRHLEYRFSEVGSTKLEVPEEVAAKFSEKPTDKGAEF